MWQPNRMIVSGHQVLRKSSDQLPVPVGRRWSFSTVCVSVKERMVYFSDYLVKCITISSYVKPILVSVGNGDRVKAGVSMGCGTKLQVEMTP